MSTKVTAALRVQCPYCNAEPRNRCHSTTTGRSLVGGRPVHQSRIDAATNTEQENG